MSDYTDFTYLDYHNSDSGQRRVDSDAIGRAFSQAGASYYGDGSEFIVGYDANGGAMIDSDAVRAAARRKAEEAASAERAEDAFMRMYVKQLYQQNAHTYLYHGRDIIWYRLNGKILGHNLLHRDENCPYRYNSVKLGPFLSYQEGMVRLHDCPEMEHTTLCPYCLRLRDKENAETTAMMDAILASLQSGAWQKEYYTLDHPAEQAAPVQKTVEVTWSGVSGKVSLPREHSLKILDCSVTLEPECIRCELGVVSPLPFAPDSVIRIAHDLRVNYADGGKELAVYHKDNDIGRAKPLPWREYEGEGYGYILRIDHKRFDDKKWDFPRSYAPEKFSVSFATLDKIFEDGGYSARPRTVFPMKGGAPVIVRAKSEPVRAEGPVGNESIPAGSIRLLDVKQALMDHGRMVLVLNVRSKVRLATRQGRANGIELRGEVELFRKGLLGKNSLVNWRGTTRLDPDFERGDSDTAFPFRYEALLFEDDWMRKTPDEGYYQYRVKLSGGCIDPAGAECDGKIYIHVE